MDTISISHPDQARVALPSIATCRRAPRSCGRCRASMLAGWKSPVLLIHGDDDRNVRFSQSTDLVRRLAAQGVRFETLVIPDDTHHFLRYSNILTVDKATADFLERQLLQANSADARATGRP